MLRMDDQPSEFKSWLRDITIAPSLHIMRVNMSMLSMYDVGWNKHMAFCWGSSGCVTRLMVVSLEWVEHVSLGWVEIRDKDSWGNTHSWEGSFVDVDIYEEWLCETDTSMTWSGVIVGG